MTERSLIKKSSPLCTFSAKATVHDNPKRHFEGFLWVNEFMTYPFCVNCIGTSMLCDDERRRSPAISAKRAKSVSRSWSAKRGERRDSDKRTSSNFLTSSNDAWNEKKMEKILFINLKNVS